MQGQINRAMNTRICAESAFTASSVLWGKAQNGPSERRQLLGVTSSQDILLSRAKGKVASHLLLYTSEYASGCKSRVRAHLRRRPCTPAEGILDAHARACTGHRSSARPNWREMCGQIALNSSSFPNNVCVNESAASPREISVSLSVSTVSCRESSHTVRSPDSVEL